MFRILAFLIISISGMGCTFDTSGVAFNNAPVDLQATADEGLRHDVGPKLDASLDIPLPDMLMDISPPDVPFDQSQLDLPPDNQVLDMPIPDAPILDAPIPDAPILDHFPWPDLVPAPDMTPPDTTP